MGFWNAFMSEARSCHDVRHACALIGRGGMFWQYTSRSDALRSNAPKWLLQNGCSEMAPSGNGLPVKDCNSLFRFRPCSSYVRLEYNRMRLFNRIPMPHLDPF